MSQDPTIIYWLLGPVQDQRLDTVSKVPVNHGRSKTDTPQWVSWTVSINWTEMEMLTKCSCHHHHHCHQPQPTFWRRYYSPNFYRFWKCPKITILTSCTSGTCTVSVIQENSQAEVRHTAHKGFTPTAQCKRCWRMFEWSKTFHRSQDDQNQNTQLFCSAEPNP